MRSKLFVAPSRVARARLSRSTVVSGHPHRASIKISPGFFFIVCTSCFPFLSLTLYIRIIYYWLFFFYYLSFWSDKAEMINDLWFSCSDQIQWHCFCFCYYEGIWAGRFLADARLRFPRGTHATVTQQTSPFFFSFFSFFFFLFSRVSRVISYCAAVYVDCSSVNSAFVHCSRTHKFHFLQFFLLKMGPTVLFIYLKNISLQCFQFQQK